MRIISASTDYRAAAERRLPPFLFHHIDGGAYAEDAVRFGADGIVVSNHGGRQLDGVLSSALPAIADAVKGEPKILADSGIRTGLDVVRMLALGADAVLLGRDSLARVTRESTVSRRWVPACAGTTQDR